jgi:hypothetical protein
MVTARIDAALRRLKDAFLQDPTRPVTLQDAVGVAGVDVETCELLLTALAEVRFVRPCGAAFVCARTEGLDA